MIINNLLNFFKQNKKIIFFVSLIISFLFLFGDVTFANEGEEAGNFDDTKEKFATVIQFITSFVSVFLSLLTYLSVMFLSPEWINGNLFGLNVYFKQIWILVSNIVYFIFAFILIWIAFMNIIGKGQDKYQLKQALPKFIVGILIVPISWFLVNFILSISAILTISAVNLPFDTFSGFNQKIGEISLPTNCTLDFNATGGSNNEEATEGEGGKLNQFFSCDEKSEEGESQDGSHMQIKDIMNSGDSSDSIFGVLGLYTYGILGIESLDDLNSFDLKTIETILDLVVKLVFDVLFVVIYAVLMIALAFVLMTRGIYIWIYIMISPLFGLMYFFDKTSGGGEFFDKFNIKQFISLSMVPVYAMLALSFGMLFMFVIGSQIGVSNGEDENNNDGGVRLTQSTEEGTDVLNVGKFKLEILGSPANPDNITELLTEISDSTMGVVGTLIMKIFGIVVLWGAVMAALRSNDVTKSIVEPLYSLGNQVGQLAAKSPQYAPVFGGQSMQSLSSAGSSFKSGIEGYHSQKGADIGRNFSDKIVGGGDQNVRKIEDNFRGLSADDADGIGRAINNTLPHVNFDNRRHVDKLVEALEGVGFENLNSGKMLGTSKQEVSRHLMDNQNRKLLDDGQFTNVDDYILALDGNTSFGAGNGQQNNSGNSQQNSGNQANDVSQRITIELSENNNQNVNFSQGEVGELNQDEINTISSINNVESMTRDDFIDYLRNEGLGDDKAEKIADTMERNQISFQDNNPDTE